MRPELYPSQMNVLSHSCPRLDNTNLVFRVKSKRTELCVSTPCLSYFLAKS